MTMTMTRGPTEGACSMAVPAMSTRLGLVLYECLPHTPQSGLMIDNIATVSNETIRTLKS